MAIKMVREPSETPNINNIDDIIPMRYAYGNQNGFIIGKGTEISNTINGLNFTINGGRLVLQGVECDIDASGVTIAIDNISTKRYYVVYLKVNLSTNTVSIENAYDTADYPIIDNGDDLTVNSSGIANMVLYKFTAINGIISEVNKVVESVKYVEDLTVQNSKKINNLEISRDSNGVLKIGDTIIPQKKLLWSGDVDIKPTSSSNPYEVTSIATLTDLQRGDLLEIYIKLDSHNSTCYVKQYISIPSSGGVAYSRISSLHDASYTDLDSYYPSITSVSLELSYVEDTGSTTISGRTECVRVGKNLFSDSDAFSKDGVSGYVTAIYKVIE